MRSILLSKLSLRLVLSSLLASLIACTDSGSNPVPPQLPDAPAATNNGSGQQQNPGTDPTVPVVPIDPVLPIDHSSNNKIPQVGLADQFEFATWNIENFPKTNQTVTIASQVLNRLNVDLIAMEEVASEDAFQQLVSAMPGYKSLLSPHQYGSNEYQKLAFVYRDADLELLDWELLFEKETYIFPRPPLKAHFRLKTANSKVGQEFYAIAVHLKAMSEETSQNRREKANIMLEEYVANLRLQTPDLRIALLGDFNEKVTYEAGLNVFKPWNEQPDNYTFQTKGPALAGEYSFISPSKPMLDHMISSSNIQLNQVIVPKLETMVPSYRDLVSDHLPVIARVK